MVTQRVHGIAPLSLSAYRPRLSLVWTPYKSLRMLIV